jgi:hypothetical protein
LNPEDIDCMANMSYLIVAVVTVLVLIGLASIINSNTGLFVKPPEEANHPETTTTTIITTTPTMIIPTTIQTTTTTQANYSDQSYDNQNQSIEDFTIISGECAEAVNRDECYADVAYYSGNSSLCSKIEDNETKDYCYYDIAIKNEDYDICNSVSDDYIRDDCYLAIVVNTHSKDESICDRMKTDLKDVCVDEMSL